MSNLTTCETCCPAGSWPSLNVDYVPINKVETISGGLQAYVADPKNSASKGVIMITDIFGIDGGRSKNIADQLSSEGYLTILPDLFRGEHFKEPFDTFMQNGPAWLKKFPHSTIITEVKHSIDFLESKGVKHIAIMGFCYGSWATFVAGSDAEIGKKVKCGINCHPSVRIEGWIWESTPEILAERQHFPHLLLPAGNDPENVKPNGTVVNVITGKFPTTESIEFADQVHGWVNRGDVKDEKVKAGVEKAIKETIRYLSAHL